MSEEFRDISGYENLYSISNLGRVYSHISGRIIRSWLDSRGYYRRVTLRKNNKAKHYSLHRLVAKSFVDGYSEELDVNHIDENKNNNNADNLEWVTHQQNMLHSQEKIQEAAKEGKAAKKCAPVQVGTL